MGQRGEAAAVRGELCKTAVDLCITEMRRDDPASPCFGSSRLLCRMKATIFPFGHRERRVIISIWKEMQTFKKIKGDAEQKKRHLRAVREIVSHARLARVVSPMRRNGQALDRHVDARRRYSCAEGASVLL